MTILVTGGAGYIGSHLVRNLSEQKLAVIVYDNLSSGHEDALLNGEKLIVADLADETKLKQVFDENSIDTVIHLAASIAVQESLEFPQRYYENNTFNTMRLIEVSILHDVKKFIFSSTAMIYGEKALAPLEENFIATPINPYGHSKLMSEWLLEDMANTHNIRYVIMRYFNVAGADPLTRIGQRCKNATHLIKRCCQTALGLHEQVEIFGTDYPTDDGTAIRDYIHVEDLAQAHLCALEYLEQGGPSTTLNVGYGNGNSVKQIISTVKKISGVDFKVIESHKRAGNPAMLVASNRRIKATLSWTPCHDTLEQIIYDAWQWEQKLQKELNL